MQIASIRQKLHQCIDESDEKLLRLMYALVMEYNAGDDSKFTEEDIRLFLERREKRLRGESEDCCWKEAKPIVLGSKPK